MRILVISYAFPPYNDIGHVRVGKTVKYLAKFGHEVRVVTAADQPYVPTLRVELPEEQVLRTPWWNVNRPAEVLFGGRKQVAQRGLEAQGAMRPWVQALRALYRVVYKQWVSFPDDQIGWYPYAVRAAANVAQSWRPDVIFASAMPYTSLLVAHRVATRYGIPWVGELRDLWVDFHRYSIGRLRRAVESRVERRVLSSAAGLVTVSEPMAARLREKYRKPTAVVLNGFDPEDYQPRPAPAPPLNGLRLVYTGMIYEGKQDPRPLFEALRLLGPEAQSLRLEFYGRYVAMIRALAEECGVGALVSMKGQIPYQESLKVQQEADALLLFLWTDPNERGVYSGKLFEYIGAQRPILAIGGMHTVASELIAARRLGVVLHAPEDIAAQLRTWISLKAGGGVLDTVPSCAGAGLTREDQTKRLEAFLLGLVSHSNGR